MAEAGDSEAGPPLSIKQRMALLQQAARTSQPQPKPSTGSVVDLGGSSAQASLSSALEDGEALKLPSSAPSSSTRQAPTIPAKPKDPLSSYAPLQPTQSPISSRASSPAPVGGSFTNRARAPSTASNSSATSARGSISPISRTQMLSGTGAALLQTGRSRSASASSARSTHALAPEVLTKLNIGAATGTKREDDIDSLMGFSPLLPSSSKSGVEWTVAPPPETNAAGSSSAMASLASIPTAPSASTPPRLPPRRPTISESTQPMTRTGSSSSIATSSLAALAPALPPRRVPVPSATLPPALPSTNSHSPATLPFRSRSQGYGVSSLPPSGANSPTPSPSLSSAPPTPPRRHARPLAGSEFESVDLGRRPLAQATAPPPPPTRAAAPAPARPNWVRSNSTTSSIASGSGMTPPHSPTQMRNAFRTRPIDPRARRRYEQLFELAASRPTSVNGSANGKGKAVTMESEPRLDGLVVRRIWLRSKLEKMLLRAIWDRCDPSRSGSLARDEFAVGMWTIDEELRRRTIANGR